MVQRSRNVLRRHLVESMRLKHEELIPESERPLDSPLRGTWTPPNPSMMTAGVTLFDFWFDSASVRRFYEGTLGRMWAPFIIILCAALILPLIVWEAVVSEEPIAWLITLVGMLILSNVAGYCVLSWIRSSI